MFEVRDNPEDSRFDALLDGRRIGELTYSIDGSVITLIHTGIRRAHEGQRLRNYPRHAVARSDSRHRHVGGRHL